MPAPIFPRSGAIKRALPKDLFRIGLIMLSLMFFFSASLHAQTPSITSVTVVPNSENWAITITGSGFGAQAPYTGDSASILLTDTTENWGAGFTGTLLGAPVYDLVTLIVTSRSDTQIVLSGFAGAYGENNYTMNPGDNFVVYVINPASGLMGSSGPIHVQDVPLVIATQPASQTAAAGGTVIFTVAATGGSALTYQWYFNGNTIAGATSATLTLTNVQAANVGIYIVTVAAGGSSATSNVATLSFETAPSFARLINISTRAQVGTGANILIPGFVIGGSGIETLLIRADGPSLTEFGVAGDLAQPSLSVTNSAGAVIASNTGWGTNSNPAQIASVSAEVGAFPFSSGSADCAVIVSLTPGAYTVQVSGFGNTSGVALAEVYEVASSGTRLVNISTRALVGTGANILIPGFVIGGSGTEELLVRGDGPSLTQFGVTGDLEKPSLSVTNNVGATVTSNTGWDTGSNAAQVASIAAQVGAFALASGSGDSAQVVDLQPGTYTMQISGVNSSTGVALAEVYEVP